jgi:hypothetical protein
MRRNLNIYAGADITQYVEDAAKALGLNASNFVRLLIKAHQDGRISNASLLPKSSGTRKDLRVAE